MKSTKRKLLFFLIYTDNRINIMRIKCIYKKVEIAFGRVLSAVIFALMYRLLHEDSLAAQTSKSIKCALSDDDVHVNGHSALGSSSLIC